MHIKESSNLLPMTRRRMLTALGGAIAYPSLQGTPQDVPPVNSGNQAFRAEVSPKWIRVRFGGEVIADSRRALIVLERGRTPVYYFPEKDVRMDRLTPTNFQTHNDRIGDASYYSVKVGNKVAENAAWSYAAPDLRGHVAFQWAKMDGFYEEGEEIFVHPRDPYHRIDVLHSSRPVRMVVGGVTVAESQRAVVLFETNFPARYYLPKDDVRLDLLRPSDTLSFCPYKGRAEYYSVAVGDQLFKDVIWYYRYPTTEASKIANNLAFYTEKIDAAFVDGQELQKPQRPSR